jgi:acetamidase/formamidase
MAVHSIEPEPGFVHFDFSREREPAISIASGDTVRVRTLDASGYFEARPSYDADIPRLERSGPGHTLCGPIGIEGARAGQTLQIDIVDIRCGTWGWTGGGGFDTPLNQRLGVAEGELSWLAWTLDADTNTGVDQHGHRVKLSPFMGVLGMPPDEPGEHPTGPPRASGGNLDCKELVAGTRLYLPIPVDGALFSVGDGHALQGDGEVSGMAIECPMDLVELRLTVVDEPRLHMPRAWTPDAWITFGIDEDLREAVAIATNEMLDVMAERWGCSRNDAVSLASLVVDVRVTQLVNGVVGAHAVLAHDAISTQ